MKRIYILLIAVFSLGMGGCNYVDVDPVGKVIPDEVSEYRALLTTAYSTYPQYRRYLMVRSDEVFPDLYGSSIISPFRPRNIRTPKSHWSFAKGTAPPMPSCLSRLL